MRYEQHHEWMEEVLESPYNIYQIVPGDLGLGRKGELEELTKDFFDAPTAVLSNTSASSEIGKIRKLDSDKAEDFKRRANQKIAEMQAEIDAMKAKHAKRVAKLQRTTVLNSAERRLRSAPTAASGRSMSSGSLAEQPDVDAIDEIASEVENSISKKIERVANVTTISKGGLQERHTERTFSTSSASRPVMSPMKTTTSPAISQSAFSQQAQHGIHQQQQQQAQTQPQPLTTTATSESSSGSEGGPNREPGQDVQPSFEEKTPADNEGMEDTELPPMDDMGMDLDTDALANNPDVENQSPSGAEWVMVDDQAEQGTGDNADMDASDVPQPDSKPEETKAPSTEQQGPPALPATAEQDAEELTLDDNAFGDEFDNVDVDTAGDALASYGDGNDEDLNLDAMDDSAFGDAFHQDDDADIS
jgi:Fungal domain of unknown function (DUF1750)